MSKTAIVTGGTRGIGAAISKMLKRAGYQVAANYAGNDKAAIDFAKDTSIDVFKCQSRLTRIVPQVLPG